MILTSRAPCKFTLNWVPHQNNGNQFVILPGILVAGTLYLQIDLRKDGWRRMSSNAYSCWDMVNGKTL